MFALIQEIDKNNPGLLLGFGGHAGAVGVNLEYSGEKHLEELFASACAAAKKPTKPGWEVDETPMTEEITKAAVLQIGEMVWGRGFPPPLFAERFSVSDESAVRGGHRKLKLGLNGSSFRAVHFNASPTGKKCLDAVFRPVFNRYYGEVELVIEAELPPCLNC